MLNYTDLHCDTLYELYKKKLTYQNDRLHLRADFENAFAVHTQVFAIWTEHRLTPDDAWNQFLAIRKYMDTAELPPNLHSVLAVEGGALLGDDLSRLDQMRALGVRLLTLVWQDTCCMGGAFNTDIGLTEFGKAAVERCFSLGIHPDLSHASDRMFFEVAELSDAANKPLLATHSNSRFVCDHRRNLTDEMFRAVCQSGGVAGISMAAIHLQKQGDATIDDVLRHIEHYCSLGGEDHVCLGCDFDGISSSPAEIHTMYDLPRLADALCRLGYSECQIEKIFYRNADNFLKRILV